MFAIAVCSLAGAWAIAFRRQGTRHLWRVARNTRQVAARSPLAALLGGLDTRVLTGSIGANLAAGRANICRGMDWLGITADRAEKHGHAGVISNGRVAVRVIPTVEESQPTLSSNETAHDF